MIRYDDNLTPEAVARLRAAAGWAPFPEDRIRQALARSAFVAAAWDGEETVGMARMIGDGLYYYLCDVVVAPGARGRGGLGVRPRPPLPGRKFLGDSKGAFFQKGPFCFKFQEKRKGVCPGCRRGAALPKGAQSGIIQTNHTGMRAPPAPHPPEGREMPPCCLHRKTPPERRSC